VAGELEPAAAVPADKWAEEEEESRGGVEEEGEEEEKRPNMNAWQTTPTADRKSQRRAIALRACCWLLVALSLLLGSLASSGPAWVEAGSCGHSDFLVQIIET
jgi:hypothetical protein